MTKRKPRKLSDDRIAWKLLRAGTEHETPATLESTPSA
jgi:hypothetical protein